MRITREVAWYQSTDWEERVRQLENEGLTRSDARAVVDAEDMREGRDEAIARAEFALKVKEAACK